jgi:hypothetical protein
MFKEYMEFEVHSAIRHVVELQSITFALDFTLAMLMLVSLLINSVNNGLAAPVFSNGANFCPRVQQ